MVAVHAAGESKPGDGGGGGDGDGGGDDVGGGDTMLCLFFIKSSNAKVNQPLQSDSSNQWTTTHPSRKKTTYPKKNHPSEKNSTVPKKTTRPKKLTPPNKTHPLPPKKIPKIHSSQKTTHTSQKNSPHTRVIGGGRLEEQVAPLGHSVWNLNKYILQFEHFGFLQIYYWI